MSVRAAKTAWFATLLDMANGIASTASFGRAGTTAGAEPVANPRFFGPGYAVAFVAVALAGFFQAQGAPAALVPRDRLVPLAILSASYTVLGTVALYAVERRGTRLQLRALIGLLLGLGAAATLLSHGYTSMMLLAVVSTSVLYLGVPGSVAVSVFCACAALAGFALRTTLWTALLQAEIAFGSGIAFVYVFSRIALREQRARAEVERLAAELALANQALSAYADEIEQLATVKERNRIAREIHDGLGHYLTVVHVQLQAAQALLTSDPERTRVALGKAQQLTHEGLGEVRRSVSLLRGAERAQPPLLEALQTFADECAAAGVAAGVQVEGSVRRLAEPIEFALYRAAQEALTNARRHARASRIEITLVYKECGLVCLRVSDNGVGATTSDAGFGLLGLRERAALIGGKVTITTTPEPGFTLEFEVPG